MGCHPFNRFNTSPFVCLSKARTWIFNAICRCLVFGVQWFEVRGDCLLCWLVELLAITVYFLFIIAYNSIQVCFFILFLLVLQSSKLHRTKMNSRNYSYEYSIRKKTTSFLNKCSILVQFKVLTGVSLFSQACSWRVHISLFILNLWKPAVTYFALSPF
jgi:hypothetical protein